MLGPGVLEDERCEVTELGIANRSQMYGGDASKLPPGEAELRAGDEYTADSGSGCFGGDISLGTTSSGLAIVGVGLATLLLVAALAAVLVIVVRRARKRVEP